jgi:acyl-CoA thioester hydrolase
MNEQIPPWRTQVRLYECDSLGHVNNAVYVNYLQQATLEIWPKAAAQWQLRQLSVEYVAQAFYGDSLHVHAWSLGLDDAQCLRCGYAIQRASDGAVVLRAAAVWASPGATATWATAEVPACFTVKPARRSNDEPATRSFHWQSTVRSYEVSGDGQVGPVEILRWVEEARMTAANDVGWTPARLRAAGGVIVQTRHDIEFLGYIQAGDHVTIRSRVAEMRRVRGTWRHEIYRGEQLVAVDYSAGAFLDLAGHPTPPPQAMVDGLLGK